MEINVLDTPSAMLRMQELPQERRADALREMLAPMAGALPPGDPVQMHHFAGGFRVDRDDPRYAEALRRMIDADVTGQIETALRGALDHLRAKVPGIKHAEKLQVMLILGDPDDEHLMKVIGGYYGMGGAPGWLYLVAWPTEENIGKIAHCAVHEFHHNVRHSNVEWNPATVVLGEHVISEGLAEAFVRELSGPEAMGPWGRDLSPEELDRAYRKITENIGMTGMFKFGAYVLGDTTARRMGQEPVGVPDMAGYPVGLRIVDAHLAATGLTVAESTVLDTAEILSNAGVATD
ncbi:uncharacterized protein YjaZ [Thermocatellispora tengchongensis]|uniref:Uncharacterized protein YjaZ n=1 Tax=Thermocatellispora tengchongensis TaxID=1073253 RepID=A0A840PGC1_9ACTN|nr:DUF2268 domain-containing putative Zn-dependent protease [Thermocatellispora tengchongensis]MBB5138618.1 uncharacterized protein YjaZ [Thermocatellispora tengchongensis]